MWSVVIKLFSRNAIDDLLEMTCQLALDTTLLETNIPYKYVVFTEKSQMVKDGWYEFISLGRSHVDPNRVLKLSHDTIRQATDKGVSYS